jgi:hypothetical protein
MATTAPFLLTAVNPVNTPVATVAMVFYKYGQRLLASLLYYRNSKVTIGLRLKDIKMTY